MKALFVSLKGGVGKSSLALNYAIYTNSICLTNDIVTSDNCRTIKIEPSKKRIPLQYLNKTDLVLDFGAMSTNIDPKVAHAARLAAVIAIPTLTDTRSLKATVETYELMKESGKPIVVIINHFTKQSKCDAAMRFLIDALGDDIPILTMRTTTLFERVSRDGEDWLANVHHNKGEYQLNKTKAAHELVYDAITLIGDIK